ncbi:MAG: hypothetical protein J7M18_04150 [Candidatus Eremiobacteraeota bacterium]|nr:hypothetical protein [Candidatus Eremiobacteraeota bacterium]
MSETFDNVLLIALPASGKSEVRTYLKSLTPEQLKEEFHIGNMVQLDDFPYVHMMRRIDEELKATGEKPVFFYSPDKPFIEPESWGVLIELLNEDYADMKANKKEIPISSAKHLLRRYDNARKKIGKPTIFFDDEGKPKIPEEKFEKLIENLEDESRELQKKKYAEYPGDFEGKSVIIEFARGGEDGATPPLPYAYEYSLSLMSPEILRHAAILYIWVTPEESRRKNEERADPNDPGSILAHGVPIDVMLHDYGCDDIDYLLKTSGKENCIKVKTREGEEIFVPLARFDNRVDKTSFIRNETWKDEEVKALHEGLKEAVDKLIEAYRAVKV